MGFSIDDSVTLFDVDAENLVSAVNHMLSEPVLDVNQIIPIYYQVMTVTSLGKVLQEKIAVSSEIEKYSIVSEKIVKTQNFIFEKFDSDLHKQTLSYLTNSIAEISEKLQSDNSSEKSKEQIESDAKMYDVLRQTMSTKEFVEQYEKGL